MHWYCLQSHMKSHGEKKHSLHWFVSQHFFSWQLGQKFWVVIFDLQLEEESDFLHAVVIQAGQKFQFSLCKNRSFLSSMTAKICFKMLMKSLVNHFPSMEFQSEIDKHLSWFFTNYYGIVRLKVLLKLVLYCIDLQNPSDTMLYHWNVYLCYSKPVLSCGKIFKLQQKISYFPLKDGIWGEIQPE